MKLQNCMDIMIVFLKKLTHTSIHIYPATNYTISMDIIFVA